MDKSSIQLFLKAIYKGEFKKIFFVGLYQFYQKIADVRFTFMLKNRNLKLLPKYRIELKTRFPIAYKSPDHIIPWGTKRDNSTNRNFLIKMNSVLNKFDDKKQKSFLDLGCSGGQLVKDFYDLGWISLGLEGSDYSLKYKRANWPLLVGKNLFTCDITKPFQIKVAGESYKFKLITAWEVLEHINKKDLIPLFRNILKHLDKGGYFIASTTSLADIHDGIDLHQTKMTNKQWKVWIRKNIKKLEPVNLHMKYYQFVRYNSEQSYLVYVKK